MKKIRVFIDFHQKNIIIGLIVGALVTISIIWFKPKDRSGRERHNKKRDHFSEDLHLSTVHDVKHEIHYLKKKGTFLDMQIKTRDGNIQLFEVTELINTK